MYISFKKTFLLMLACTLTMFLIVACANSTDDPAVGTESSTSLSEVQEATEAASETAQSAAQSAAQTEAVTKENEPTTGMTLSDDLIRVLRKYLQDINMEYELIDVTYADKLDMIRNGTQAVYAEFDPSEVYYACAYYPLTETDTEIDYCCVSNYTWIGYEDPGDIQEYYDGAPCIVSFQINRAGSVRDILSDEKAAPGMEHFQMYKPMFQNGVNVSSSVPFDDSIVYLHSSGQDTVYFASAAYDYRQKTMLCTESDDLVYLAVELYTVNASGNRSEANLTVELGVYYDALMRIMILDQYQVQKENGSTMYYGLLKPGDLVKEVF